MKVKTAKREAKFQPFDITIKVETLDELYTFYAIANMSDNMMGKVRLDSAERVPFVCDMDELMPLYDTLDSELKALGL